VLAPLWHRPSWRRGWGGRSSGYGRRDDAIPEMVRKMSSERIRAKLIRNVRDKESVLGMSRQELLDNMAQLLLEEPSAGDHGDTDREVVVPVEIECK